MVLRQGKINLKPPCITCCPALAQENFSPNLLPHRCDIIAPAGLFFAKRREPADISCFGRAAPFPNKPAQASGRSPEKNDSFI